MPLEIDSDVLQLLVLGAGSTGTSWNRIVGYVDVVIQSESGISPEWAIDASARGVGVEGDWAWGCQTKRCVTGIAKIDLAAPEARELMREASVNDIGSRTGKNAATAGDSMRVAEGMSSSFKRVLQVCSSIHAVA